MLALPGHLLFLSLAMHWTTTEGFPLPYQCFLFAELSNNRVDNGSCKILFVTFLHPRSFFDLRGSNFTLLRPFHYSANTPSCRSYLSVGFGHAGDSDFPGIGPFASCPP